MNSSREEATVAILQAKQLSKKNWTDLAKELDCSPVFLCSVCMGQNKLDMEKALKLCKILGITPDYARDLNQSPLKCQQNWETLRQDPVINRLHEINLVYATSIKELIHENFGDGIMSAIDFTLDVDKVEDPVNGDRVKIVMSGKFLPFKKW